jgi:Alkylmercury lyase
VADRARESEIDEAVRLHVYTTVAATAQMPATSEIASALAVSVIAVEDSLRRLAAGRALVLAPNNVNVWMANPFSAVPTPFKVHARGKRYFAPCIWDALGIPAALHADAVVETSCGDCGAGMRLDVRGGSLTRREGIVHFALPPRRWWDNVGFT